MNIKKDWRPDEFKRVVTFGESITAGGWSTSRDRCWASLLASLINDFQNDPVELFNAGIGANVISTKSPGYAYSGKPTASERLETHVIAHRPDLLIISYGLNDARSGTPLNLFKDELELIIQRIRQQISPLIILLGPYYINNFARGGELWGNACMDLLHQFNSFIADAANRQDCLYVDILSAFGCADWLVHYDGVHCNDLGHRIIANEIFRTLAQNCSCLAAKTRELERSAPRWRDESTLVGNAGGV